MAITNSPDLKFQPDELQIIADAFERYQLCLRLKGRTLEGYKVQLEQLNGFLTALKTEGNAEREWKDIFEANGGQQQEDWITDILTKYRDAIQIEFDARRDSISEQEKIASVMKITSLDDLLSTIKQGFWEMR